MQALDAGDYGRAWQLLEGEPEARLRAAGRTYVTYAAGDFGATLLEAPEALELTGEDLNLLYRAAWAAVTLGDLTRAEDYASRLGAALGKQHFEGELASFWSNTQTQLRGRVAELQHSGQARDQALSRAKWFSLLGLGSVLGWIAFLVRA